MDWPIGTGLADWHWIDQVLEIGELILDQKVDLGMASDWHRIGFKWPKNGIRLILDCAKDWPCIGADLVLWRKFRPPRRLGTIPYRRLVPWLSRQTSSEMA